MGIIEMIITPQTQLDFSLKIKQGASNFLITIHKTEVTDSKWHRIICKICTMIHNKQ